MRPAIFQTDEELGQAAAVTIFDGIRSSYQTNQKYVLGCPGGRSPRSTFSALARLISVAQQPLSHVTIAMMDEFVAQSDDGIFENVDPESHFSCRRFALLEIRDVLNSGLAFDFQIPVDQVLVPEAGNPEEYESLLRTLGIDCFILASGTTDGHVAFNAKGTDLNATTRISRLAEDTRFDNLSTFPNFASIDEVPIFGVTVGPGTIAAVSKSAIMLLQGKHKFQAFNRISNATHYETDWPATIIAECKNPLFLADASAAGLA